MRAIVLVTGRLSRYVRCVLHMVGHDGHAPCMLPAPIVYSRSGLLLLQSCARPPVDECVVERVRQLCVRRHRDRRAGRAVQARACRPPPTLRSAGNGAYVIARNRPPARVCVYGSDRRNVKVIPTVAHRHARPVGRDLVFGSLNVRSLSPVKLDDLLVEIRDRSLDVTLLCETWHDADSVAIRVYAPMASASSSAPGHVHATLGRHFASITAALLSSQLPVSV